MHTDQEVYDKLSGTDWTYRQVAEEHGINPNKFEELMVKRFENPNETKEGKDYHLSYTLEWAMRVKKGRAEEAADSETLQVMKEAGYKVTA